MQVLKVSYQGIRCTEFVGGPQEYVFQQTSIGLNCGEQIFFNTKPNIITHKTD